MADLNGLAVTIDLMRDQAAPAVVVAIGGEIDQATAVGVEQGVERGVSTATDNRSSLLVIDLTEVTFCGSAGLAQVVKAQEIAEAHGLDLVLVATPGGVVERVLKLTDLTSVFSVVPTREQALSTLRSRTRNT